MEHRVSQLQLEELLDYLATHPALAKGVGLGARSKENIDREWNNLAQRLNAHGSGASKNGQRWKRYWADIKHKAKSRAAARRQMATGTGGGPSTHDNMSEVDLKILDIIGEAAVYGDSQHRVPVFETLEEKDFPRPVSQDIFSENIVMEIPGSDQDHIAFRGDDLKIINSPSKSGQTSQINTPDNSNVVRMLPGVQCDTGSPAKCSRPKLKRSLCFDESTKKSKTSNQSKVDHSWVINLEERRIAAEEKLANAAMIMAEAARINSECTKMHCEIMLKLIDNLNK